MQKRIILNWMPPAMRQAPSPSMSCLQSYLSSHGYNVNIIYWNLRLEDLINKFLWNYNYPPDDTLYSNLLFMAFWAVKRQDTIALNRIQVTLMGIKPNLIQLGTDFFIQHIKSHVYKLEEAIKEELRNADIKNTLYIENNFAYVSLHT